MPTPMTSVMLELAYRIIALWLLHIYLEIPNEHTLFILLYAYYLFSLSTSFLLFWWCQDNTLISDMWMKRRVKWWNGCIKLQINHIRFILSRIILAQSFEQQKWFLPMIFLRMNFELPLVTLCGKWVWSISSFYLPSFMGVLSHW